MCFEECRPQYIPCPARFLTVEEILIEQAAIRTRVMNGTQVSRDAGANQVDTPKESMTLEGELFTIS